MITIRIVRFVFAVVLLGACIYVGTQRINQLPPLGPFLDPAHGVWSVARVADLPPRADATIPTLEDSVIVVYDRRGVPHIQAASTEDAIRALGYLVARDRLFQMELQSRAAAGRLTEWFGERALETDRHQRAIGLPWSAEKNLEQYDPQSETMRLGRFYAEGVNAWIGGMRDAEIPLEHRLLGTRPEFWEPLDCFLTFKRMGYTLTYDTHDRGRSQLEELIGQEATSALFPLNNPIQEPIQPTPSDEPRFNYRPLPPPPRRERNTTDDVVASLPSSDAAETPPAPPLFGRAGALVAWGHAPDIVGAAVAQVGSNNWAVSPSRSATGHALLAGDPHLGLTLPSIWYEVHIQVPDDFDVYGVTIPGIPGIVIGFNRDVAWSFTNTGADVLDYYRETLDHDSTPSRYLLDGEWRELEQRVERFFGRDGDLLAADTLYATHRGPVLFVEEGALSMRWTVLEDAGSLGALTGAAGAGSVAEFEDAMSTYHAPAQNMIVADRTGSISIRSTGRFPIRPGDGDGSEIRDGTSSDNDWLGYWPLDDYPASLNPEQGYLASANQQPVAPRAQQRYLGVNWPAPWRALRINRLLRRDSTVTVEAMSRYQTDPGNEKTNLFLPAFLLAAERVLAVEANEELEEAASLLDEWDRLYTKDNERAVLFETAMDLLTNRTWDELIPSRSGRRLATPGQSVLASLLQYPESRWWDHGSTEEVETRDDILASSLVDAFERVKDDHGPPDGGGWRWEEIRHANIWHLLGFPALSALDLPVRGGPGNLNPSSGSGTHGASWRMVVGLGQEVQAWVNYPGGQSGNPVSRFYDDRIQQWVDGSLDAVLFPSDPAELGESDIVSSLTLEPEGD